MVYTANTPYTHSLPILNLKLSSAPQNVWKCRKVRGKAPSS